MSNIYDVKTHFRFFSKFVGKAEICLHQLIYIFFSFFFKPKKVVIKSELISVEEIISMGKFMGYLFAGLSLFGIMFSTVRRRLNRPKIGKQNIHQNLIGRFLTWLGSRIFTFGNVSRDTSLIIGQSGLTFFTIYSFDSKISFIPIQY